MAEAGFEGARGKIWAVVGLVEKHGDGFLRADLVRLGCSYDRVGQPTGISWDDLYAWLIHADHTTATYRAIQGHSWSEAMLIDWFASTHLGVANYYAARAAGAKHVKKPVPYPLPDALKPQSDVEKTTLGKARPVEEIDAWLIRKNGR